MPENLSNDYYNRFEAVADYYGVSIRQLASTLQLSSPQAFYDLKRGKVQSISRKLLEAVKRHLPEVSTAWLLTGEGSMLTSRPAEGTAGQNDLKLSSDITNIKRPEANTGEREGRMPLYYTLRRFRKANSITQAEVEDFLCVARGTVSQVESGLATLSQELREKLINNDKGWDASALLETWKEHNEWIFPSAVDGQAQKDMIKKLEDLQKLTSKLQEQNAKLKEQSAKLQEQNTALQEQNAKLQEQNEKSQSQIDRLINMLQASMQ